MLDEPVAVGDEGAGHAIVGAREGRRGVGRFGEGRPSRRGQRDYYRALTPRATLNAGARTTSESAPSATRLGSWARSRGRSTRISVSTLR